MAKVWPTEDAGKMVTAGMTGVPPEQILGDTVIVFVTVPEPEYPRESMDEEAVQVEERTSV